MQKFDRKKNNAKIVNAPKPKVYGDDRDKPDYGRSRSTMPPRQRAGATYAGGKRLRRALRRLEENRKGTLAARASSGKQGKRSLGENAFQMPGAMNP